MPSFSPIANGWFKQGTPSKDWQAAAAATTDVAAVDTNGFVWCTFIVNVGVYSGAGNTTTWTLSECATSGGSYTAVSGGTFTVTAAANGTSIPCVVDCRQRLRFLKLTPTHAGTNTTTPYGTTAILSLPEDSANFTQVTPGFTV